MKKEARPKKKKFRSLGDKLYGVLTRVRFSIGSKTFELDLGDEVNLGTDDPKEQFERIPGVMGYFGSVLGILEKEYEDKKSLLKHLEGKLDKEVREAGARGEQRILQAVRREQRWLDANLEINKAKRNMDNAKRLYYALSAKSDIIRSRSADTRAMPSDSIVGVNKSELIRIDSE